MKKFEVTILLFLIFGILSCNSTDKKNQPENTKVTNSVADAISQINNRDTIEIYKANELISLAKTKGLNELEEIISPINLVHVDSSFASTIIDLEFKFGFWSRHYENKDVIVYEIPRLTLAIAEYFNNLKAGEKLFEYYSNLPKLTKSDTLYSIYNNLDDYLKVLVKFTSPRLIEKLKKDYNEWTKLAQKSPKKKYPTIEEIKKMPFEESMKFKSRDLIIDCNFILLQLAGALKYLNVKGFDDTLIENLKKQQTYPFAQRYKFPIQMNIDLRTDYISSKTLHDTIGIIDFGKDYKKLEKLINDNFEIFGEQEIYKVIEKDSKVYVSVFHSSGYGFYKVRLIPDDSVIIDLISGTIE